MLMAKVELPDQQAMDSVEKLLDLPYVAAGEGWAAHAAEHEIWQVWVLGRSVLGQFLRLQGTGDVGETGQQPDGRVQHRLRPWF